MWCAMCVILLWLVCLYTWPKTVQSIHTLLILLWIITCDLLLALVNIACNSLKTGFVLTRSQSHKIPSLYWYSAYDRVVRHDAISIAKLLIAQRTCTWRLWQQRKYIGLTMLQPISPWTKMGAISRTIPSGAFSWVKCFVYWLTFHWSLLLRLPLSTTQRWLRQWLIYRAAGGDELMYMAFGSCGLLRGIPAKPAESHF